MFQTAISLCDRGDFCGVTLPGFFFDPIVSLLFSSLSLGRARIASCSPPQNPIQPNKITLVSHQDKRAQKKSVKMAFTTEAKVISHALANPEAPQNRSVFSYS